MITGEIKSKVDKIWDAFATGGVSNPLTVIEQFTFLLFIRRLDEQQTAYERKVNLMESKGLKIPERFQPIFEKKFYQFRWTRMLGMEPENRFELFIKPSIDDLSVFDHMKTIGQNGGVFGEFMKGATFMIGTPRLLDQVMLLIAEIPMKTRDTKGDLYEYMLGKIATAGRNGQFRTPRHIIRMMVDMVKPQKDDTICDPSSGTAGFLVSAGEYIQEQEDGDWFNDKEFRQHFDNKMFTGVEFDSTMIRIGAMNLQLHGIKSPNLIAKDALSEGNGDLRDEFSLILANPPFKGSLDYDGVESSILKTVKTKKTELLFLGLILRMLKVGGRAAVIVPQGVQFGSSNAHKAIRQEIVEKQKLDAVISLPSGVFKPYAGVSTAILIFTKTESGGTDNVWFYDLEADGYSLDDKRSEIKDNDIPDVISRFTSLRGTKQSAESERKRTDKSFLVRFEEIKANDWDLSINRYKEVEYEEVKYDSPKQIIKEIQELDKERNQAMELLMEVLK